MASISRRVDRIKQDLSHHLPPEMIEAACRRANHTWRQRILDPVHTVQAFLLQVLHYNTAMTHVARLAGSDFTPSAYCQARQRLPLIVLQALLLALVRRTRAFTEDVARWHGHRTFLIDGSSCSMPDTPGLQRAFGQPSGQKPGCGFPVAHLLALFDAYSGMLVDMLVSSWRIHDLTRVAEVHPHLQPGDLLVADRGFCSYAHLAVLRRQGIEAVIRVGAQRHVSFGGKRFEHMGITWPRRLGRRDQLTRWFKTSVRSRVMSPEAYDALPAWMLVRELQYHVAQRGYRTRRVTLVTTLLDCDRYPVEALAELYYARWQAETNLRDLKRTLGMNVLKSRSEAGVRKELLAFALVYNLVCMLRTAAAMEIGVSPNRMSFVDALRALQSLRLVDALHALQQLRCLGPPYHLLVNPHRPGRHEPRVRKRRPPQYSLMTQPRDTLRNALKATTLRLN